MSTAVSTALYALAVRLGMDPKKQFYTADDIYQHARELQETARNHAVSVAKGEISKLIAERDRAKKELRQHESERRELLDDNSRLRGEVANRLTVNEANDLCMDAVKVWKDRAIEMRNAQRTVIAAQADAIRRLFQALRDLIAESRDSPEQTAARIAAEELLQELDGQ